MFEDIGRKIRTLAEVLCWIGIISSVIGGIILIAKGASLSDGGAPMVIIGIAVMIIGPLLSWVSSFVLYGFGQLIDNTDAIKKSNKEILGQAYNIAQNVYVTAQSKDEEKE